jgi:hypothetical protein
MNLSVKSPPEIESMRQQRFSECFGHIDANTFQSIPLMAMPRLYPSRFEPQMTQEIGDYCNFMEKVLQSIAGPLGKLEILPKRQLVTVIQ